MMRPSAVVAEDQQAADECDCHGNEAALMAVEISSREVRDQQEERNKLGALNSADQGQQDREDSVENDDSDFEYDYASAVKEEIVGCDDDTDPNEMEGGESEGEDEYHYSDSDDPDEGSIHQGKQLAEADAAAIDPSDGIHAKVESPSSLVLRLYVSILPWRLYEGLGSRTVEALGLDPTKGVQVMLTADRHYTNSNICPRVSWVRQVTPDEVSGDVSTESRSRGSSFPLEWMLRKRLEEALSQNWPPTTQSLDTSVKLDESWDAPGEDSSLDVAMRAEAAWLATLGAADAEENSVARRHSAMGAFGTGLVASNFDAETPAARRSIETISECTGASKELAQYALRQAKCEQQAQLTLLDEESRACLHVALAEDRAASLVELRSNFPGADQTIIEQAVLANAGSLERQRAHVRRVEAGELPPPLPQQQQQQQQPHQQHTLPEGGRLSGKLLRWRQKWKRSCPSSTSEASAGGHAGGVSPALMSLDGWAISSPAVPVFGASGAGTDFSRTLWSGSGGASADADAGRGSSCGGTSNMKGFPYVMDLTDEEDRRNRRVILDYLAENNLLLRVALVMMDKVRNANKRCLVCDDPIEGYLPAVPIVCSKELCIMSSEDMGCGTDIESQVENKGDTVDLLINLFVMAMQGNRPEIGFPNTIQWDGRPAFEHKLHTSKDDVDQLRQVLSVIPSVTDMQQCIQRNRNNKAGGIPISPHAAALARAKAEVKKVHAQARAQAKKANEQAKAQAQAQAEAKTGGIYAAARRAVGLEDKTDSVVGRGKEKEGGGGVEEAASDASVLDDPNARVLSLREALADRHPLAYVLLRWLLSANRAHLRPLSEAEVIQEIPCEKQFVLVTGTAEREAKFQMMKRDAAAIDPNGGSGSFFAFHGSRAENWHGILREGLKNMSGTKYMSAGAAFGKGIYMAENLGVALGYASRSGSAFHWTNARTTGAAVIVAMCEVVDRKREEWSKGPQYFVVPDEECVVTRFLLINPKVSGAGSQAVSAAKIANRLESLSYRAPEWMM